MNVTWLRLSAHVLEMKLATIRKTDFPKQESDLQNWVAQTYA